MSSLIYNKILPTAETRSTLYGELKLSIRKFPTGKLSSIFVSGIIKTSTFPIFISSTKLRPTSLLKKRLWHRCFPVNFAEFLRTPFLQNSSRRLLLLLVSILILSSSEKFDLHSISVELEILPTQCQSKTLDICSKNTSPETFESFWLTWSLRKVSSIFFEWPISYKFLFLHICWKCTFSSHPFSFNFALSVSKTTLHKNQILHKDFFG